VCENGFWCVRYNSELYVLFSEPDIVKTIKMGRLQWAGHVISMLDDNPIKNSLTKNQMGVEELEDRDGWKDGIEDGLRMLNVRQWRRRVLDRRKWKNVIEVARAQTGAVELLVVIDAFLAPCLVMYSHSSILTVDCSSMWATYFDHSGNF
jgi:hypothetical protein